MVACSILFWMVSLMQEDNSLQVIVVGYLLFNVVKNVIPSINVYLSRNMSAGEIWHEMSYRTHR